MAPAQQLFEQAYQLLRAGSYAAAESCFRQLIPVAPTWATAHCCLAVSLANQGKLEEAAEVLKEASAVIRRRRMSTIIWGCSSLGKAKKPKLRIVSSERCCSSPISRSLITISAWH